MTLWLFEYMHLQYLNFSFFILGKSNKSHWLKVKVVKHCSFAEKEDLRWVLSVVPHLLTSLFFVSIFFYLDNAGKLPISFPAVCGFFLIVNLFEICVPAILAITSFNQTKKLCVLFEEKSIITVNVQCNFCPLFTELDFFCSIEEEK